MKKKDKYQKAQKELSFGSKIKKMLKLQHQEDQSGDSVPEPGTSEYGKEYTSEDFDKLTKQRKRKKSGGKDGMLYAKDGGMKKETEVLQDDKQSKRVRGYVKSGTFDLINKLIKRK